jgi:sulfur carrier protein ThiS
MNIELRLVGRLKEYRQSQEPLEVPAGVSVTQVLALIGMPDDEAGMVAVNGTSISRKDRPNQQLEEGDSMTVLAPVHGG